MSDGNSGDGDKDIGGTGAAIEILCQLAVSGRKQLPRLCLNVKARPLAIALTITLTRQVKVKGVKA